MAKVSSLIATSTPDSNTSEKWFGAALPQPAVLLASLLVWFGILLPVLKMVSR